MIHTVSPGCRHDSRANERSPVAASVWLSGSHAVNAGPKVWYVPGSYASGRNLSKLGLSYHQSAKPRFMANDVTVDVKDSGAASVQTNGATKDDSPHFFVARMQCNF